ncbi:branched-chain amino acid ABC transporter permease [Bradyrhizobium sp. Ce-3]|uniref:branched-chain amino acid ABC transporter permease n=1 Tax=Bradyrhizobium sp. Ce-3 TaxID=2913970 RepID=UPI001FC8B58C|nr:branched-chain amino acid ABC transporter permease [Bradyrhizobium sp. Ce-3]GKQ55134.1 branched-chain amino acid ABC transporter permease [Bradyrhizobium sp. Ce-3]
METLLLTQVINVVYEVLILAIIVLGLAVVMGLLNVLNIAHGEFIMIGAYTAYVVQKSGLPYVLAVPAAAGVCGIIGLVVERFLIRPLRYEPFETLLATWGLGLLLRKLVELGFGRGYRSVEIPVVGSLNFFGEAYPTYRLVLMGVSASVLAGLFLWYRRAPTGARIRAMVGNPVLAEAVGIKTRELARNTFVTGTAMAGIAGVMIAPLTPVEPFMGLAFIVNSFFALVVGGMGTVAGLFAGAGIIGGLQSVLSATVNPTTAYLAMLFLSILFLWQRPRGLFPRP